MVRAFHYVGNKIKFLKKHPISIPEGTTRVVELYGGSGTIIMNNPQYQGLLYEYNPKIASVWKWLKSLSQEDIDALEYLEIGSDIKSYGLEQGKEYWYRMCQCGVFVGNTVSRKVYAKRRLPTDDLKILLPRIKEIEVIDGDCSAYQEKPGDWVFIDPPYLGTKANYRGCGKDMTNSYSPQDTIDIIKRLSVPWCMTYGDTCKSDFPMFDWKLAFTAKLPILRGGGTKERGEWIAYG
jgi:site-specific DNA-adenine methylase